MQVRAYNLDFPIRRDELAKLKTTAELVREACRIAKLQGSNQLSITELVSWLGESAPNLLWGQWMTDLFKGTSNNGRF